jgi:hypothetical protein
MPIDMPENGDGAGEWYTPDIGLAGEDLLNNVTHTGPRENNLRFTPSHAVGGGVSWRLCQHGQHGCKLLY